MRRSDTDRGGSLILFSLGLRRSEHLQRFTVTAALEEMAQLGIDRGGQLLFELLDPFRNSLQTFGVAGGIAAAFFVGDDREALAQGGGQVGHDFFHR